ncbi:MAG: hypothetical protein NTV49_12230 [Kiritimatiellaeota bacterium]|nr:hypothetical protein [Kiritimatiellota bacterium]
MKSIGKAILVPLAIAIFGATIYIWKMVHVWPPGKEGWLEEGMYMMAFHAFCIVVLLPFIIWSIAHIWSRVSGMQKLTAIVSGLILLACTVILPELIIKNAERIRPNHAQQGTR